MITATYLDLFENKNTTLPIFVNYLQFFLKTNFYLRNTSECYYPRLLQFFLVCSFTGQNRNTYKCRSEQNVLLPRKMYLTSLISFTIRYKRMSNILLVAIQYYRGSIFNNFSVMLRPSNYKDVGNDSNRFGQCRSLSNGAYRCRGRLISVRVRDRRWAWCMTHSSGLHVPFCIQRCLSSMPYLQLQLFHSLCSDKTDRSTTCLDNTLQAEKRPLR